MQFMGGGDLLSLLIERDTFPEEMAKFYIAEIILAVEETHQVLGAIHRDIKPDNFLFDQQGHIAIAVSCAAVDAKLAPAHFADALASQDFGLATDFHWSHDGAYYEQHRKDLLKKHGIDLGDRKAPPTWPFNQDSTAREAEEEPNRSLLTHRDRNRRRLAYSVVGTNNYMAVE